MRKLARNASGLRHLRWAREIAATIEAHAHTNYLLVTPQEEVLAREASRVKALVLGLRESVKAYRDYLEHSHVETRARTRVARLLCDEAHRRAASALRPLRKDLAAALPNGYARGFSGESLSAVFAASDERAVELAEDAAMLVRSLPGKGTALAPIADDLEKAASTLRAAIEQKFTVEEAKRRPLKAALERAIGELREGLEETDGRLRAHFSQGFLESIYPHLDRAASSVLDDPDDDDDASAVDPR